MKKLLLILLCLPMIGFGQIYAGSTGCLSGDCENGKGFFVDDVGNMYIAEFIDGVMNGEVTINYANDDKYVGEIKDDRRHGQGAYTYADGTVEKGLFENNKFKNQTIDELNYKEPKDKYGTSFNSVIGWSNTGLFAYRNVGEDDGIGEYDNITIINLSNNQRVDGLGFEGETWTNNENTVNTFLSRYNIQQINNPTLFSVQDIKHIPCVKDFLSLENEDYRLLGYYKSPFDKKIVINIQIRMEEHGGGDMYGNINHIYFDEYYECILK